MTRPRRILSSPLAAALDRFLDGKRAAGYRYHDEARALAVLDRFLAERLPADDPVITQEIVRAFVARRGDESKTTRGHRLSLMRELCRFLALEEPRTALPGPRFLGIHRRTFVARVLTHAEGRRFLEACERLPNPRSSPLRGLVLGSALVVLYLAGLRASEGLHLTEADVDLTTGVLRVRDTKFGKSRLVPLATDVVARLARCRHQIVARLGERGPDAPFFPARSGQTYSVSAARFAFHQVLADTDVVAASQAGRQHKRRERLERAGRERRHAFTPRSPIASKDAVNRSEPTGLAMVAVDPICHTFVLTAFCIHQ